MNFITDFFNDLSSMFESVSFIAFFKELITFILDLDPIFMFPLLIFAVLVIGGIFYIIYLLL